MPYLLVCLILLFPALSTAANVYIDPSCANNGDGTTDASCSGAPAGAGPFNTWGGISYTAGNSYLQKRGTTFVGNFTIAASGSSDAEANRIILDAYGTGADPIINATGEHLGVTISGARSYITIRNYEIYGVNATAASDNHGLRLCDSAGAFCTGIHLSNLVVHDIGPAGGGNGGNAIWGYCTDCVLDNVTVYNIATDGMNLQNIGGLIVRNSHCHDVQQDPANVFGDCLQITGPATTILIEDNIFDHTNIKAKHAYIDNSTGSTSNIVRRNQFLMSSDGATQAFAAAISGTNAMVYHNIFRGGDRALTVGDNATGAFVTAYGNVMEVVTGTGVLFTGINNSLNLYSNSIYSTSTSGASGVDVSGTSNALDIRNNVIRGFGIGVKKAGTTTITDSKNSFYENTANGSSFTPNANSVLTDPLQVAFPIDLRTHAASPARRAGISGYPCADVRGRACYPDRPDIGAYQSTSGDPAATRSARN